MMNDVTGKITNAIVKEDLEQKWDIVNYNRMSMFDADFNFFKNEYGFKFVMDLDDDWILPTNHINYYDFNNNKERIENNIRCADLVTVTNKRLYDKVKQFNDYVTILPNALPYETGQFIDNKIESDKIRIFWCGSITHEGDLESIKNPLKRLKCYANNIEMVIGGYDEVNNMSKWLWDKMVGYFTCSKQLPYKILPSLPPNEYMSMYDNADIILIPLMESEWAASKSNLKILEAASRGVTVICQAVEPYINDYDAPVLWVYNQSDWFKHLNFLINNPEKIKEYGQKTKEWAARKYNFHSINEQRKRAFECVIKI